MHKQRVLVTGASTGIGKAIASLLHQNGYDVIGTSRNPAAIQDKISGIRYYPLDLQDSLSIDVLVKKIGDIDILINNAGQSQVGPLEEVPMEKVRSLFEVNLFGIIQLIKGIIPSMRVRRTGTIINISSMSGVFGVGFTPVYCGTKFALEGISRSLRQEVRSFGIKVVLIEPGYIHTTLAQDPNYQTDSEYYEAVKVFKGIREHNINTGASPEAVAKKILDILCKKNPKPAYPVGGDAPRNAFLVRVLPIRLVEWFQRKKFRS